MKVKTSVTLTRELVEAIDCMNGEHDSRSEFLESAAWEVIRRMEREARDAKDAAIYAMHIDEMNAEAAEAREFQVDFESDLD